MTQLTAQEQNLLAQITAAVRQVVREELEAAKPAPVEAVAPAGEPTPAAAEPAPPVVAEQPAKPAEQHVVAKGETTKPPKWYESKKKAKK